MLVARTQKSCPKLAAVSVRGVKLIAKGAVLSGLGLVEGL